MFVPRAEIMKTMRKNFPLFTCTVLRAKSAAVPLQRTLFFHGELVKTESILSMIIQIPSHVATWVRV